MRSCPTPDGSWISLQLLQIHPRENRSSRDRHRCSERTPMGSAASSPPGHRRVSVPRQLCKKDFVPPGEPAGLGRVGASGPGEAAASPSLLAALLPYGLVWTSSAAGVAPARRPLPIVLHSAFCLCFCLHFREDPSWYRPVQYAHFVICTIPLVAILRDTCWEDL